MTLTTVLLSEQPPTPWKNGGGTTRDVLAWPSAGAWACRISVADVVRSGPFSAYPGVERHFAVVQGAGVQLRFFGRTRQMTVGTAPLCFDGADAPGCDLIDGATLDLNLMVQAAAGHGTMAQAAPGVPWRSPALLRAVFTTQATVLAVDGQATALPALSLAYSTAAAHQVWDLAPGAAAWWLSFHPHTP